MDEPVRPTLDEGEHSLLEVRLPVARADRKRIIPLAVEVPPGTEALAIFFDYRPRWSRDRGWNRQLIEAAVDRQAAAAVASGVSVDEGHRERALERLAGMVGGMRTLFNLALHDPAGALRGRWDQNEGSQVEEDWIGAAWASPGYVAGAPAPGRWTASIEVHEVLVEPCLLRLRIAARRARPAPAAARTRSARAPAGIEFPTPLPAGWVRGELHSHSTASDGRYAVRELLERARAVGLDFIALTDHNSVAGLGAVEEPPLPVIPGCEITTFAGHFLSLGLRVAVPWYSGNRALAPRELAAAVRAAGGLFGLAHPHVLGDPICVGCRLEAEVRPDDIDLLEVWSRGPADPLARRHALASLDELWRRGRRATATAGRDWHGPGQERAMVGQRFPATCLRARPEPGSLLSALRRGACYLSVGPHLELELRAGDRAATLGDELRLGPAERASLRLRVAPLEAPARLRLLLDGRCLREERVAAGEARVEHDGLGAGALRVELWGEDGELLLASSPVALRAEAVS
jgi:hypothetical protein